jgi:hypothetical protein
MLQGPVVLSLGKGWMTNINSREDVLLRLYERGAEDGNLCPCQESNPDSWN